MMNSMPARLVLAAAMLTLPLCRAAAQDEGVVQAMASILAVEDARRYDEATLLRGLTFSDTTVRARAALAVGRIGDLRGTGLLVPVLDDESADVRPAAAFALGLLRDTFALEPLINRVTVPPGTDLVTTQEVVTAIARIGGKRAGDFFNGALSGRVAVITDNPAVVQQQLVAEAWRLGPDAPVNELLPFLIDTSAEMRWRAIYTTGRLRQAARASGPRIAAALRDKLAFARALAARTMVPAWADSAGLARENVADLLAGVLSDPDAGVRINALRSLGLYRMPATAPRVVPMLEDQHSQVILQAIATLGDIGGPEASAALVGVAGSNRAFGYRREALLALARSDTSALRKAAEPFTRSSDWRERAVAAEADGIAFGPGASRWLEDRDGRVVAAALQAWAGRDEKADPALVSAARPLLGNPDVMVRAAAATALMETPDAADIPGLGQAWRRSFNDSIPDAGIATLDALAAIARTSPEAAAQVESGFLRTATKPTDYVILRWAEDNWAEAASKWGSAYPLNTGRTAADYREIARRYFTGTDRLPHIFIEVDQKGTIEIELLGPDAPMTVASFLQLVGRRYFDRLRFHRVVPNFVVQDGDPRGDGNGGPGFAIRDEINRWRYSSPMLGMALSGPDTGGSQWFINVSPQPHLDGTYTIFGRLVGGQGVLARVLPGDQIRTIRR